MFYNNRSIRLFRLLTAVITIAISSLIAIPGLAQRNRGMPAPRATGSEVNPRAARRLQRLEAASRSWVGLVLRDPPADSQVKGVLVESVISGSPAENAGLRAGDIITSLAGKPVTSAAELAGEVAGLRVGEEYQISVIRAGERRDLTLRPAGRFMVSESGAAMDEVSDKPAPRKGFLDINVLKYALIDPRTRSVTFIGKYDPAYDTGPIAYADLLRTALEHPYPSFSLEPTKQTEMDFQKADRIIEADLARMNDPGYCSQWTERVGNLLLYDTTLQADSKRFFRNCAEAMGISADELKQLYDTAMGRASTPPAEFMRLSAKLMHGIGLPKTGDALSALASGGSPEELLRKMADALGLISQFENLEAQNLSPETFRKEAIILCISEICRQFEAPEGEIQSIVSSIRSNGQPVDAIIDYMGRQMSEFITKKAGKRMLDGLVLGPQVLSRIYDLPVPKSELVFSDLPSDSLLGDIFFKSDYRLKSICTFPDARERMRMHLAEHEFMRRETLAQNMTIAANVGAGIGHTLIPGDVVMRVSPAGDVVEFQASRIKVHGWVRKLIGSTDSTTADFFDEVTRKYADFLSEHFDDYAKVYPEWHKLSEAAKTVALARWARKNNYGISVSNAASMEGVSLPKYVNGFWSAVFEVEDNAGAITFIQEGGTSFSEKEGDGWLKAEPDVTITSDVSKQLAASAVFAQQAVSAAISGDLEAARELAEKSAMAMTGEIDLTSLPSLDGTPIPSDPASYAAASAEAINQASECLEKMKAAEKDLVRASEIAASSPDEAAKITEQAHKVQDEAQEKLKEILSAISAYRSDPARAGEVLVALRNDSATVAPITTTSASSGSETSQSAVSSAAQGSKPVDWDDKCAKWSAELDEVNKQIAVTREAILRLNASVLADRKLFEEWEGSASEAFDRCVGMAADVAIDFGVGAIADRYDTIYELAKKLPGKPEDVIEKYRYLASLAKRMQEAKATSDFAGLAERENKTEAGIYETFRDGIGQIMGLVGLDKTVPGKVWKYGSLAFDMAFNLTELRETWKNVSALEANNQRYAEALKKLTDRMRELHQRASDLKKKIEAEDRVGS